MNVHSGTVVTLNISYILHTYMADLIQGGGWDFPLLESPKFNHIKELLNHCGFEYDE